MSGGLGRPKDSDQPGYLWPCPSFPHPEKHESSRQRGLQQGSNGFSRSKCQLPNVKQFNGRSHCATPLIQPRNSHVALGSDVSQARVPVNSDWSKKRTYLNSERSRCMVQELGRFGQNSRSTCPYRNDQNKDRHSCCRKTQHRRFWADRHNRQAVERGGTLPGIKQRTARQRIK